jgi:uracil-DNA glycosylase family 4
MAYAHVLGASNGPLDAALLIVGEAPGRLGAARTGIPFQGDRSGDRLEQLLKAAALDRSQVFITNAVLCNPLTGEGEDARNRPPRSRELEACSSFLQRTLAAVPAPVVVALGRAALKALDRIEVHGIRRVSERAGQPRRWAGRTLVPLVHPSPRTQGRRSWSQQLQDWTALGQLIRNPERQGQRQIRGPIDRSIIPSHDPLR